jgi:hypothetical protein
MQKAPASGDAVALAELLARNAVLRFDANTGDLTSALALKDYQRGRRNMEKYHIKHGNDGWAVSQNEGSPKGAYATREGALEAVYLAASNDIKKGLGISIVVDPPAAGEAAIGGSA